MKSFFVFAMACMISSGCGIVGEKPTVTLKSNGITAAKGDLMADKIAVSGTEFTLGTDLEYVLSGVSGFSLKDDKALFGCSMTITDLSTTKQILTYDDLFSENKEGYNKEDASVLTLTLSIGDPMIAGRTYRWNLRVWDKRGQGDLTAEIIFKAVEGKDLVGIKTEPGGLNPKLVYILSNGPIKSTDIKTGQKISLIFSGVEGYAVNPDSTVSLGVSMLVLNKDNTPVLQYSDLFQNYPFMSFKGAKMPSVYLTVGDPMKVGQTYLWKVRLWDKNNQNSVESSVSFTVFE